MNSFPNTILSFFLLTVFLLNSCRKEEAYFKDPETEPVIHTIIASSAIGYCSSLAVSVMAGEQFPGVYSTKSCSDYPCASLIFADLNNDIKLPFTEDQSGQIVIAGLWTAVNEGILTLFFYNIDLGTSTLTLKNVHTFPVTEQDGKLLAVFAGMDINLGSNPILPVELDLSQGEITFELERLDLDKPNDISVAVEQHAYFIQVDQEGTPDDLSDDYFTITGGGQLIEVTDNKGGVIQQALLDVLIENTCLMNPTNGYALIKNTSAGGNTLPELGTAIFNFHSQCDGMADISLATGVYILSNGKSIPLLFN